MSTIKLSPCYPRALQPRAAVGVMQAVQAAPTLARLVIAAQSSAQCLQVVGHLLPAAMHSGVQAGPIDDGQWCLLVANSAVAAKLRQLTPTLLAHLRTQGYAITTIRIKMMMRTA